MWGNAVKASEWFPARRYQNQIQAAWPDGDQNFDAERSEHWRKASEAFASDFLGLPDSLIRSGGGPRAQAHFLRVLRVPSKGCMRSIRPAGREVGMLV